MGTQRVECHFRLRSESGQTAGVEVKRKTAGVSRNECGVADPFFGGGGGGGEDVTACLRKRCPVIDGENRECDMWGKWE